MACADDIIVTATAGEREFFLNMFSNFIEHPRYSHLRGRITRWKMVKNHRSSPKSCLDINPRECLAKVSRFLLQEMVLGGVEFWYTSSQPNEVSIEVNGFEVDVEKMRK